MCKKKTFAFCLFVTIVGFAFLTLPLFAATPAHAQSLAQDIDNGNCIKCHEDLYFLHDTGNWFCIRESPMRCVDCHGGNPEATTQETAHYDRSAHPVVNEDISKCQECHPAQCDERVAIFSEVAGISSVKLSSPVPVLSAPDLTSSLPAVEESEPVNWLLMLKILPFFVIAGVALTICIIQKVRHS
jgi:hypothetical protein